MIRGAIVPGLALGGVLLGHAITYAGLAPGAVAREMLLAATGHAYLDVANRFGVLAILVAVFATVLGRVVGRRAGGLTNGTLTARLVTFQVGSFVVLEVAERLGTGASLSGLASALAVGLVIQVSVAVGLAAIIRWLLAATDRLVAVLVGVGGAPPVVVTSPMLAVAGHQPVPVPDSLGSRAPPRAR